jgi:adenylate cyclase
MRTVRSKLLLVVAFCVIPAILAAWFHGHESEDDLLDEVRSLLDNSDEAFAGELKEDLGSIELTLDMVRADPRLSRDLVGEDLAEARKLIQALGSGAEHVAIALADWSGRIVAASGGLAESEVSKASLAHLAKAFEGQHVHAFLPFDIDGKPVYALTMAEPVLDDQTPVGVLILAKPVDNGFLDHARKLGSHWALSVNGKVVAHSTGHPAPALLGKGEARVEMTELDGRHFAMNSFRPAVLQRPGEVVVVTASRDVTELRAQLARELWRTLAILTAVLLLAVALSLRIAHRMVLAIRGIGRAAEGLKTGQYLTADGVHTGDELEELASAFNQAVAGLRERDQIKETFGKYVTRQVVERILAGKAVLGGEMVPVTVLFSDIRGFTSISEKMEPTALLDFLNVYFSGMVDCVMRRSGVVDKFIGDAIMAVFGAPVPQPDDALRAVNAALDMRERLEVLNEGFVARGLPRIKIGIGIHSGMVVAGNMGHVDRMEYTVIGDPVNLASRLESLTKELGVDIVLSEDTYQKVKDAVDAEPLREIQVRGREQAVRVYQVLRRKDAAQAA